MNIRMILITACCVITMSAVAQGTAEKPAVKNKEAVSKVYTFTIIPSAVNTWGYQIFTDRKLSIHQPTIPGVPGDKGFKTMEDAAKVAEAVIKKMVNGEIPPSLTNDELKKLNVL